MWEVLVEIWMILLVAAVLGMAIGYIFSNILSTSKIELLEEENWQLKEDLRKYRSSLSHLETELAQAKQSNSKSAKNKSSEKMNSYEAEIKSLKAELASVNEQKAGGTTHQDFLKLKERHQDLLAERERLLDQLDRAGVSNS